MQKIFVSSCLTGARVRHDGGTRTLENQLLATWRAEGRLVVLCPEMAAGLPSPRPAAEIAPGATAKEVLSGRAGIYDINGLDVTYEMTQGARLATEVAQAEGCRFALLADGSPSCGSTYVHSGDFDGQRHAGEGVVAASLRAAGVAVYAPDQLLDLARDLEEAENTTA